MPLLEKIGWRIYNVVGSVKDFLNTPRPRRAERPEGVPGARWVTAESLWCFFITRSVLNGGAARAVLDKRRPETSTYFQPVKRRRALLASNPLRNSRWEAERMSGAALGRSASCGLRTAPPCLRKRPAGITILLN